MENNSQSTTSIVRKFNDAINGHDIDAAMALMTNDCIFENTFPSPDGSRYEGWNAVRSELDKFLISSPKANFVEEELFAFQDRCVVRWKYSWGDGHVRGVDVMRIRDGKICEKLSYVKG